MFETSTSPEQQADFFISCIEREAHLSGEHPLDWATELFCIEALSKIYEVDSLVEL